MKRWQKILMFFAFFLISVATFVGLRMYFAADKKSQADTDTEMVSIKKIKNSGYVVTKKNPANFQKDDEKDLGTKQNPFLVLEICPNEIMGQAGWLIAGAEPVDVDAIINDAKLNGGLYGANGTAYTTDGQLQKKFFLSSEGAPNANWQKGSEKEMRTGYLRRLTQQEIDEDENLDLVRYSLKGYKEYYEKYSGSVYNQTIYINMVTFKYVGADYAGDEFRYSPQNERNASARYAYNKDENGHYVFVDGQVTGSNGSLQVDFVRDDAAGEYIVDEVKFSRTGNDATQYNSPDFGYDKNYHLYATKGETSDNFDATNYTTIRDDEGMYTWVEDDEIDLATTRENKDFSKFVAGQEDKLYTELEYTQYQRYSQEYYSYNRFLINCIGLGADYGYAGNGGPENEHQSGADVKYPKKLANAIKNYHIGVKTISPSELQQYPEWIDKADFIYFTQSGEGPIDVDIVSEYAKVKRLRGQHAADSGTFTGNEDITWDCVERIMNRAIKDKMCGIFMDCTRIGKQMEADPHKKVYSYQYSFTQGKITSWTHTSSKEDGYLNNYYKLCNMMLCMNQDKFMTYYWKAGLIEKANITVGGKTYTTGRLKVQPDEDSQFYWTDFTFMPCYYNTKLKKNVECNKGLVSPFLGSGFVNTNKDWLSAASNGGKDGAMYAAYGAHIDWRGSQSGANCAIWGQVVTLDGTSAFTQNIEKAGNLGSRLATDRVDPEVVYEFFGWSKDPETGEWLPPGWSRNDDGELVKPAGEHRSLEQIFKDQMGQLSMTQGINHVLQRDWTPPKVGETFEVLDIEASNWWDVDSYKYSDREVAELLQEMRVDMLEDRLTLEEGMTVNITYVTPDALNAMTNNFADDYDLIVIGDSTEHARYKEYGDNNETVNFKTYNGPNLKNYTKGDFIYSHSGEDGYGGNDITQKTLKKIKSYVKGGNALLIWEQVKEDSLLKLTDYWPLRNSGSAVVQQKRTIDTYEVDDSKVQPGTNMHNLMEFLAIEAQAYDSELWIDLSENARAGLGSRGDEVTATEYMQKKFEEAYADIAANGVHKTIQQYVNHTNGTKETVVALNAAALDHTACVMTGYNVFNLKEAIDSYATKHYTNMTTEDSELANEAAVTGLGSSSIRKVAKQYYSNVVISWADTLSSRKPEIVFKNVPREYQSATTSAVNTNTSFIEIADKSELTQALNYTFTVEGLKGTYNAKLYIDYDANGAYIQDEVVAQINGIEVSENTGTTLVGSTVASTAKRYSSTEQTFAYSTFDPMAKDFLEDRVGGFTWKIEVTMQGNTGIKTEKTVTSALKRVKKKNLRILQLVPDKLENCTLNMQDETENGWIKKYTKDLVDYRFAVTTMTVSEFESLYDPKITSNSWVTKVETENGLIRMKVSDKCRLTYDPANEKTDRLAQFDVIVLGFTKTDFPSINNKYGALDNLMTYIHQGNSVVFGNRTTSTATSSEELKIPADIANRITSDSNASEGIGSGDASDLDEGEGLGYANPTSLSGVKVSARKYPGAYVYTKLLRAVSGLDRYGVSRTDADTNITVDAAYLNEVKRTDSADNNGSGTYDGFSYKKLIENGKDTPFKQMATDNDKLETQSAVLVNDNGQITAYPYDITNDIGTETSGTNNETAMMDTFRIAKSYAQPYQLYLESMATDNAGNSVTAENNVDSNDVTVWATLEGDLVADKNNQNIYSASPKNASNNYYLYAKGNIFYIGLGANEVKSYDYTQRFEDGGSSAEYEIKDSDIEKKLFINTIIAAYSKAKDLLLEVPEGIEVNTNDYYYYLASDDIDNILNYKDDDVEYILFRVSDSKSTQIAVEVMFEDGERNAYPVASIDAATGTITYDTGATPFKLKVWKYQDNPDSVDTDVHFELSKKTNQEVTRIDTSALADGDELKSFKDAYIDDDDKAFPLNNSQLYVIEYQKKLVNNPEKDKLLLRAVNGSKKVEASISIMGKGYFQLD